MRLLFCTCLGLLYTMQHRRTSTEKEPLAAHVQIVHVEVIPARAPKFGEPDHPLPTAAKATLEGKGIRNLFCHQAEALNAVAAGRGGFSLNTALLMPCQELLVTGRGCSHSHFAVLRQTEQEPGYPA